MACLFVPEDYFDSPANPTPPLPLLPTPGRSVNSSALPLNTFMDTETRRQIISELSNRTLRSYIDRAGTASDPKRRKKDREGGLKRAYDRWEVRKGMRTDNRPKFGSKVPRGYNPKTRGEDLDALHAVLESLSVEEWKALGENTPEYKARLEREIERRMRSGKRTPFKKSAAGQALDAQREISRKRARGEPNRWAEWEKLRRQRSAERRDP